MAAKKQLSPEQFDALWEQAISEPQPDWLRQKEAGASDKPGPLSSELLESLISYMRMMEEKRADWRQGIAESLQQAQEADFFAALLALFDGQEPSLIQGSGWLVTMGMSTIFFMSRRDSKWKYRLPGSIFAERAELPLFQKSLRQLAAQFPSPSRN